MHSFHALILCTLLAGGSAVGQTIKFDSMKHLEGFEERYCSVDSDLYDLERFEAWDGKMISAERLEELRREWLAHRDEIDQKVAAIKADPDKAALRALELQLQRHEFFKNIAYEKNTDYPPFALFIERPRRDSPNYYTLIAEKHGPWLVRIAQLFEERYVRPLGLKRRQGFGRFAVTILASGGSYKDYYGSMGARDLAYARAHYEPQSRIAITYEDLFSHRSDKEREEHRAIVHEVVHMLQHAYSTPKTVQGPRVPWFMEGLANHLSTAHGDRPTTMNGNILDTQALRNLGEALADPGSVRFVNTLRDLVAIEGPGYRNVLRNAMRRGLPSTDEVHAASLGVFYAQSTLLTYFLDRDASPYRDGYLRYVKAVMEGRRGWETFGQAMAPHDPARIEREFLAFVREEFCRRFGARAPSRWPELLPVSGGAGGVVAADPSTGPKEADEASPPPFDPARLAFRKDETQACLAAALRVAAEGDVDGGIALLEGRKEELLQRELKRLRDLVKLRKAVLEDLKGRHGVLRFKRDGKTLRGRVSGFDDERIVLHVKRETVELPVSEITAKTLLSLVRKSKAVSAWQRGHLRILAGRTLRESDLDDGAAESQSLREDASRLAEGLRDGEVPFLLARVARFASADAASDASRAVDAVERLVRLHGKDPLVVARRADLEACCRSFLDKAFGARGGSDFGLRGAVESLPGDRIRVTYEFDRPDELEDFQKVRYLDVLGTPRLKGSVGAEITGGALVGSGPLCLVHHVAFAGPTTVTYELTVPDAGRESFQFYLGVCDDGFENGCYVNEFGGVIAVDRKRNYLQRLFPESATLELGHRYSFSVALDGAGRVTVSRDGDVAVRLAGFPRRGGRLLLWMDTPTQVRLDRLVVEGGLTERARGLIRRRWVERRMKGLGF